VLFSSASVDRSVVATINEFDKTWQSIISPFRPREQVVIQIKTVQGLAQSDFELINQALQTGLKSTLILLEQEEALSKSEFDKKFYSLLQGFLPKRLHKNTTSDGTRLRDALPGVLPNTLDLLNAFGDVLEANERLNNPYDEKLSPAQKEKVRESLEA
jgi:hypothetical protein